MRKPIVLAAALALLAAAAARAEQKNVQLLTNMSDYELQRTTKFSGIPEFWAQDAACQESMGTIYDRTQEHLGTSDLGVIRDVRIDGGANDRHAGGERFQHHIRKPFGERRQGDRVEHRQKTVEVVAKASKHKACREAGRLR